MNSNVQNPICVEYSIWILYCLIYSNLKKNKEALNVYDFFSELSYISKNGQLLELLI